MSVVGLIGMLMDICDGLGRSGNLHSGLWATNHYIFAVCILLFGSVRDRTLVCGLSYGFMQCGGGKTLNFM